MASLGAAFSRARRPLASVANDEASPPAPGAPAAKAWRLAVIAALAFSGVLGAPVLRDEWISAHLEAAAAYDVGGPPPKPWDEGDVSTLCKTACTPRGDAALAVSLTVLAARELDDAARDRMLTEAQTRLAAALAVRPNDAGWWTWLAYARFLAGKTEASVIEALARGYDSAPFLAQEGPWRVRRCAEDWALLSPGLRAKVINEVVWMRDVDPDSAARVRDAFAAPDAAAALRAGLARPSALLVPHRRSGSPGGVGAAR